MSEFNTLGESVREAQHLLDANSISNLIIILPTYDNVGCRPMHYVCKRHKHLNELKCGNGKMCAENMEQKTLLFIVLMT